MNIKYRWSPEERTCRVQTSLVLSFSLSLFLALFPFCVLYFFHHHCCSVCAFSRPTTYADRKASPSQTCAIVALWVSWEPERADSGMRLGILTCWTFVVELSTSLCPHRVYVVIQRSRDEFRRAYSPTTARRPLAFMNLSGTWTPI